MLVPPDVLPEPLEELELDPVCPDELEVEPLCPEDPDEEDCELGLWDDGELLGELLGEGMLGDGMLELGELGELGGGELLLDEQPASASVALRNSVEMPRFNALCPCLGLAEFIRSAPCGGPWRRQQARRSPIV